MRDHLTGLFNRRYMEETLVRELLRAARKGLQLGLTMPDASFSVTRERAEQILKLARWAYRQLDGQDISAVTLSVAVVLFPEHGETRAAILKAADAALYRAKHAGRNRALMAEGNGDHPEKKLNTSRSTDPGPSPKWRRQILPSRRMRLGSICCMINL